MKIMFALLVAYVITGTFHSIREYYRGRQYAPDHQHHWFICGLTWFPTSIVFPFMSTPWEGQSQIDWFMKNIKDSIVSWSLFGVVVWWMLG
jgi:hypothetical protein